MNVEKSRASAREAVSSRWATRAETSSRMKKHHQQQQQQQQQQNQGSLCSNNILTSGATNTSTTTIETSTNVNTNTITNENIIHATWRQIQHSLGWSLLQQLDKEQRRSTQRRRNNTNNTNANGKSNRKSNNKNSIKTTTITATKQIGNNNKRNPNSNSSSSSSRVTKKQSNVNENSNDIKTQDQKSITKAKNAQMLANTITQMRVTTALQNQLESITNQNYDDDYDNHDNHQNHKNPNRKYNYLRTIITILPTGFDESSALIHSIQHRKRAFFLIDFGQVIKSHAQFLSYTCGFEDQIPVDGTKNKNRNKSNNNNQNNNGNNNDHHYDNNLNCYLPPTHRLKRTVAGVNSVMKRRRGIYIQPQFSVTKNPNIELLKLLVRLGVDLRCNSSDDIMTASQAIREECRNRDDDDYDDNNNNEIHSAGSVIEQQEGDGYYGDQGMVLVDDASKTRKPNGYFRRLLQTRRPGQHEDLEVSVDDVDEVKRISNTIRQLATRNNVISNNRCCNKMDENDDEESSRTKKTSCRFMLRLPLMDNEEGNSVGDRHNTDVCERDNALWEALILNVYAAAKEEGGELFGVSVDLSQWSQLLATSTSSSYNPTANKDTSTVNTNATEEKKSEETTTTTTIAASTKASNMLYKICTRLRLFRLLLLSVGQYHIRIDITGLPPLTRENCDLLTTTLSNVVSSTVTFDELKQIHVSTVDDNDAKKNETLREKLEDIVRLANNPATCSLFYTADVSTHLVARAGALCARIIGSKVTTPGGTKQQQLDSNTIVSTSVSTDVSTNNKNLSSLKKEMTHYFIDDGCYGSLGSSSSSCTTCNNSTQQQKHTPFHLYGNGTLPKSKSHLSLSLHSSYSRSISPSSSIDETLLGSAVDPTNTTSNYGPCTVWGPTCDGLDKVCESVYLPKDLEANRDWLVFSNLGCGGFGGGLGLGTAFNGFDPPDVEYCVLGYFSGGSFGGRLD